MTNKINLYVNSGNRKADETTTNLRVIVPSGLINRMVRIILHCPLLHFIVLIHCIKWMNIIQISI